MITLTPYERERFTLYAKQQVCDHAALAEQVEKLPGEPMQETIVRCEVGAVAYRFVHEHLAGGIDQEETK